MHADILHVHKGTKYRYKMNFANAVGPCRSYLHGSIDETALLVRSKLAPTPIRPDRHVPRPSRLNEQSSRGFNYRASYDCGVPVFLFLETNMDLGYFIMVYQGLFGNYCQYIRKTCGIKYIHYRLIDIVKNKLFSR